MTVLNLPGLGQRAVGLVCLGVTLLVGGCRHSRPGTHVEIIERGGQKTYYAGAAAQGLSKGDSCRAAVRRSVNAIALRFAQDHDDLADDIADALGASDGAVFLQRYAKNKALSASVKKLDFRPTEHYCTATVHWVPPVFVKDAVTKFAQEIRAAELAGTPAVAGSPTGGRAPSTVRPASQSPTAMPTAPPAAVSVAPPVKAITPASVCRRQAKALAGVKRRSERPIEQLRRCLEKTDDDRGICHGYVLRAEEAGKKELEAGSSYSDCLNRGLSTAARGALVQVLTGHAAVAVENRGNGSLILWTYSPADQTAYVLEVDSSGMGSKRGPLAANQIQWVRSQLGL